MPVWRYCSAWGCWPSPPPAGWTSRRNQPYTPAEGVNFDVGNPSDPKTVVHVRNLLIISKAPR